MANALIGYELTTSAGDLTASIGGPYQVYAELGAHDGRRPVIGRWLSGDKPRGIGIRESPRYVTDNTACFVPHVIG